MPRREAVAVKPQAEQAKPAPVKKVRPHRSTRQFVDVDESHVEQKPARAMKSTGKARESLDPPAVQTVERPVSKSKLDMLVFMEEELAVMVHESTDPNDEPVPMVQNNGIAQFFIRGQEQKVKRKYVEILARAKKTSYSQQKAVDGAGNEFYRNIPHTAPRFPFTVISDPNPRGTAWLKALRAEA